MILVVGAGSIGKRHLRNLVSCGITEMAVVDPRADRLEEARAQVPTASKLRTVGSLQAAFTGHERYDAVVVASPPAFHPEAIRRAVEAGLPILCEKPLATDDGAVWSRLKRLCATAAERGILSMVGYNYRFLPHLQQVRRLLAEGAVGSILSVRGTFSEHLREWHPWEGLNFYMASRAQGGGALLDESHLLDLCRWLFGEITEVAGYNGTLSTLGREPGFDTDDLVELVVRFASGAVGSLHMDLFGRHHQKRLEVIGEEGTLCWHFDNTDIASNRVELWRGRRERVGPDITRRMPEQVIPSDGLLRNHMYLEEARYFLQAIRAGRHLRDDVPDLRDGLQTLAVVRAARRAAASRRTERVGSVLAPARSGQTRLTVEAAHRDG